MTAQELLDSLNLLDERENVEAKRAREVGVSVMETVSAFANEPGLGGGWLLLGVTRDEKSPTAPYGVEGLLHPDKVAADLASQCNSVFNRPMRIDISTQILAGKAVIVVHVPELPAHEKPLFIQARGLPKGAFRRVGSADQKCNDDDIALLFQGRQQDSFDFGLVSDAHPDDLSHEALQDYRKARAETNPDAEELGWSDDELLQALGGLRRDTQGRWMPTVAGLLLFGKPAALRRCFPMTRVDYIRVPGREWVPDPERRFDTVELRDPLFRLIRRAQAAVLDDLPKAFGLADGALQREDKPLIPQRVIREAVVNAVMHRSYRDDGTIQIIRYADRLEIRNPGYSLKSPEHLGEPGSTPRNPRIAAVLHETRFAETKGSGIRVMREMTAVAGLTPPLFESDRSRNQFVVRLYFHHLLGEDDLHWLAQFKDLHLSEAEARGLVLARATGAIDNATYRDVNKVDTLTASASLRRLRDAGLLAQRDRGSATWYCPTPQLLVDPSNVGLSSESAGLSSMPMSLSSKARDLSREQGALFGEPEVVDAGEAPAPESPERAALLARLPADLAGRARRMGRRRPPADVEQLIVDLCALQAWRAEELATLLGRKAETVRQSYLRPLMQAGRLVMALPEQRTSPDQTYRTVGSAR